MINIPLSDAVIPIFHCYCFHETALVIPVERLEQQRGIIIETVFNLAENVIILKLCLVIPAIKIVVFIIGKIKIIIVA